MIRAVKGLLAVGVSVAVLVSAPRAQTSAIQAASKALSVDTIFSLRVTGAGSNFTVGQAFTSGAEWPRIAVKSYTAWTNYDTGISRVDLVREMLTPPAPGGGVTFAGEQTQNLFVSGNYAWNGFPPPPPAPEGDGRAGGPGGGRGGGRAGAPGGEGGQPARGGGRGEAQPAAVPPGPGPQPAAVVIERRLALWATPHGFLKAAADPANKATTRRVGGSTEVSLTIDGKYRMTGMINSTNEVASVRTWIPNPVMGDMVVETTYSDYRDFGEVRYPSRVVQRQGGQPALELTVSAVERNPNVSFVIPGSVYLAPTTPAPVTVASQEVAPGVFYLTGGSHHSVAIAQRDHIVLIDLPQSIERGEAVLAKTKELIPNKPVRFVINTHAHFDHTGGLRAAVAEGATIVTHQSNQSFLQSALSAPRTLQPDRAATRPVKVQGVAARHEMSDGSRRIQLHQITNNRHAVGFLMVYLPTEKILVEADAYSPAAAGAPAPTTPNLLARALADDVGRLKLDVAQILAMHGPRVATMADLKAVAAVGQ